MKGRFGARVLRLPTDGDTVVGPALGRFILPKAADSEQWFWACWPDQELSHYTCALVHGEDIDGDSIREDARKMVGMLPVVDNAGELSIAATAASRMPTLT
ncbi:hypothetical protein PG996_009657 [Apiospora saccharicola]|uniref:Uncharacterized protein n=1 Tax=Apiospora saccharicola TaxID=335842 RepID=A0ABR1ULE6_9PEZI